MMRIRIRIRIHVDPDPQHCLLPLPPPILFSQPSAALVQPVSFVQLDLLKLEDDVLSQPPAAVPAVVVAAAAATAAPLATDPWADFHQPKKSFYSSSDSDSGEY
jgi:hypothetical protein